VKRSLFGKKAVLWAVTACAAAAVLMPAESWAATQPGPVSAAGAGTHCRGVTLATFPAQGFITDAGRKQGGHLWWRPAGTGTCIGTVVEDVQYNAEATQTWRVIVYDSQFPGGDTVARQTFTAGPGVLSRAFGVHQVFTGLTMVCLTANDAFGTSCVNFGAAPAQEQFAQSTAPGPVPAQLQAGWPLWW
jgi:hypothetical protein